MFVKNSCSGTKHHWLVMAPKPQVFLSPAGGDAFEVSLLQFAFENLLADIWMLAFGVIYGINLAMRAKFLTESGLTT